IAATPLTGLQTFLITKTGKPYRSTDLSDEFAVWRDQAGIDRKYTLHGLRHTMGKAIVDTGGKPHEVAAVLGHAIVRSALHYSQDFDSEQAARNAMARLRDGTNHDHSGNSKCQTTNPDLTLSIAKPLKDWANG